ncbi:hypothetical protein QAD02_020410 [Eretmocerus hayati]|uniref:Uncharacterized protein n=1 Tax=Eretmocerus hayati TaxID=131215 RepID=A0ACC2PMD7_9HYME|nr:hypothetical protein QAD02_020410 [Eretmocerus hayati]
MSEYRCFYCDETYCRVESLMAHVKLRHESEMNSRVTCNIDDCRTSYHNVYSLVRHIKKIHDSPSVRNPEVAAANPPEEPPQIIIDSDDRIVIEEPPPVLNNIPNNLAFDDLNVLNNGVGPDMHSEYLTDFVLNCALLFVTHLYAYNNINRAAVHAIISAGCSLYIGPCFDFLRKRVGDNNELHSMFDIIKNGFKHFKTEFLTFKYLQEIGCLFLPTRITLISFYSFRKRRFRSRRFVRKQQTSMIKIDQVLKKFLELPGVFESIEKNINHLTSDPSPSFFNATYWKSITAKYSSKIVFPLVLYFDDFEINNPLDSRKVKSKIGAVYCSILGIPSRIASQLENILLMQLHKYIDHRQLGN